MKTWKEFVDDLVQIPGKPQALESTYAQTLKGVLTGTLETLGIDLHTTVTEADVYRFAAGIVDRYHSTKQLQNPALQEAYISTVHRQLRRVFEEGCKLGFNLDEQRINVSLGRSDL